MVRTYLDWLIELPWAADAEPPIDIAEARRILDDDHFGLEKIKRRILEYLAVRKLNPDGQEPDPVLRRPARRRQDVARPEHREGDRAQVRPREPRRRRTTRRRSAATGARTSARCRATSSRACARRARATA